MCISSYLSLAVVQKSKQQANYILVSHKRQGTGSLEGLTTAA